MMHNRKNAMTIPNDISWIKAHLREALIWIEEISKKIVYRIDEHGNVIFYNNVSIMDDDQTYNIKNLFELVWSLEQDIGAISDITNITELMTQISNMKKAIEALEAKVMGFYRDGLNSITHFTDNVSMHNDLTFDANDYVNASIIGFGGHIGLNVSNTSILCSVESAKEGSTVSTWYSTWKPPIEGTTGTTPKFGNPKTMFLLNLLRGTYDSTTNAFTFDEVDGKLDFTFDSDEALTYDVVLDIKNGKGTVSSTGMMLELNIAPTSNFIRHLFIATGTEHPDGTGETYTGLTFPQATYPFSSEDMKLTFATTSYKAVATPTPHIERDGGLLTNPSTILISNDNSVKIANKLESGGVSTITFAYNPSTKGETTYLNAYVKVADPAGPTTEEWEEYVKEKHIESYVSSELQYDGLVIDEYQTGDNKIKFTKNGSIEVNDGNTFALNVESGSSTTPVINVDSTGKLTESNVENIKMSNYDSLAPIASNPNQNNITVGTYTQPSTTGQQDVVQINSNAVFRYYSKTADAVVSVSIDELRNGSSSKDLKLLTDRVITLERANAYQTSDITDNAGYTSEAPTDATVYDTYLNPPVQHTGVNP